MTSIVGRDRANIVIAHSLTLIGSMIMNADYDETGQLTDKGELVLKMAELYYQHITSTDGGYSLGSAVSVGTTMAGSSNNPYQAGYAVMYGDREKIIKTRATVGGGKVTIGNISVPTGQNFGTDTSGQYVPSSQSETISDGVNRLLNRTQETIRNSVTDAIEITIPKNLEKIKETGERILNGEIISDLKTSAAQGWDQTTSFFGNIYDGIKEMCFGLGEEKEENPETPHQNEAKQEAPSREAEEPVEDLDEEEEKKEEKTTKKAPDSENSNNFDQNKVDALVKKYQAEAKIKDGLSENLQNQGMSEGDASYVAEKLTKDLSAHIVAQKGVITGEQINAFVSDRLRDTNYINQPIILACGPACPIVFEGLIIGEAAIASIANAAALASATFLVAAIIQQINENKQTHERSGNKEKDGVKSVPVSGSTSAAGMPDPDDWEPEEKERKSGMPKSQSKIWKELKPHHGQTKTNGLTGKDRRYYQWDGLHDEIEVYDQRGKPIDAIDPTTGERLFKDVSKHFPIKL